ncbi:hypothetical protein Tco_1226522 [Tanacetum coccineum]
MVERASTQGRKTCSGVHLLSQRSKFGYGGNTNKMLHELQNGEEFGELSLESMDKEEVALVDGVFDGAFGALSDEVLEVET